MLFTARLVDVSVQIGDNNSSQLLGLLGGLNELRDVKPLEQLLAQPRTQLAQSPTAASDCFCVGPVRSHATMFTMLISSPGVMGDFFKNYFSKMIR